MQTYGGKAFEIDLDEGWKFFPDSGEEGLLYFEHQRLGVSLSCDSMILVPHDRDLDELGIKFIEAYVGGLGKGAGMWSAMQGAPPGVAKIFSVDPLPAASGREWIISGAYDDARWLAWIVLRNYMHFTMRMESRTLVDPQLADLFHHVRQHVFLGELVPPEVGTEKPGTQ